MKTKHYNKNLAVLVPRTSTQLEAVVFTAAFLNTPLLFALHDPNETNYSKIIFIHKRE